jgi:hypothetical protein
MEGLLTWTAERVAKFPRDHKFTVGDRLLETCLDVMAALTEAAYRRDKREVLTSASRGLVRARILARLARVLLCLSEAQHLHFARDRGVLDFLGAKGALHLLLLTSSLATRFVLG